MVEFHGAAAKSGSGSDHGQVIMLIITVIVSGVVTIFVAKKILAIWRSSKLNQNSPHEEALMQVQSRNSRRNGAY